MRHLKGGNCLYFSYGKLNGRDEFCKIVQHVAKITQKRTLWGNF